MKQTAVEWLIEQMNSIDFIYFDRSKILEKAKEIEKQQIIDAYCDGRLSAINKEIISYEQYYNETFKTK